jgi:hypothetical protein
MRFASVVLALVGLGAGGIAAWFWYFASRVIANMGAWGYAV